MHKVQEKQIQNIKFPRSSDKQNEQSQKQKQEKGRKQNKQQKQSLTETEMDKMETKAIEQKHNEQRLERNIKPNNKPTI